jgi:hypothetical protein
MTHLVFNSVDNCLGRIYYRQPDYKNQLVCFQQSIGKSFALYVCSMDGEPSYSIGHEDLVFETPLPTGDTQVEELFRQWLVREVVSDINSKVSEYLQFHAVPTEFDQSINDYSREMITRINDTFGQCILVKLNLYGNQRGKREAIAQPYATGENWNAYNFCADYALPLIDEETIDLILQRDQETASRSVEIKKLNEIEERLSNLGAMPLLWS